MRMMRLVAYETCGDDSWKKGMKAPTPNRDDTNHNSNIAGLFATPQSMGLRFRSNRERGDRSSSGHDRC